MAAHNLLALIDDIATILDDVALMTKAATQKTAGVLGDDLALNAQQVTGVSPDRELPVVWAVAKGSLFNKAILVPSALLISALTPWLILPLLTIGGLFLCYEGFEKISHKLLHPKEDAAAHRDALLSAVANPAVDLVALERDKIKGAIRTDFILSAEIIVISLGVIAHASFSTQVITLISIAIIFTVGVYGLVAAIVRLDDLGLALSRKPSPVAQRVGSFILIAAPWLMKSLGIVGTAAMFLVGGGIVVHAIPGGEALVLSWSASAGWLGSLLPSLINGIIGLLSGALCLAAVLSIKRLRSRPTPTTL